MDLEHWFFHPRQCCFPAILCHISTHCYHADDNHGNYSTMTCVLDIILHTTQVCITLQPINKLWPWLGTGTEGFLCTRRLNEHAIRTIILVYHFLLIQKSLFTFYIRDYIHYEVWNAITYPFPNWVWKSYFVSHTTGHMDIIPYRWSKYNPCQLKVPPLPVTWLYNTIDNKAITDFQAKSPWFGWRFDKNA